MKRLIKAVALSLALSAGAAALPEGGNVTHGSATITNSGTTQTIRQGSNKAIINWNGFNIDVGELVHFVQPNSASAVLNRVIGQDPSQILGAMRANGKVFLINPNGVVFGSSAQIDVGSLVVSTLNITDNDFLEGRLHFEQQPDKELAAVINQGTIRIDDNGFLVLTGPMVANEGLILAKVGQVALAAGETSTVSFDPTGLLQLELPAGSDTSEGIVSLTQAAAGELLSNVVSSSTIEAGQLVTRDGQTYLEVESGTVVNTGEIIAEGSEGQRGGKIVLDSTANTLLADGGFLSASGQGLNSDGGEVYLLSDGAAESEAGSRIDIGGGTTGDGGFAEQSSETGIVRVVVDSVAEAGVDGTFLVDPERIVVQTGDGSGSPNPPPMVVAVPEDTIEAQVGGTFALVTEDGIDFEFLNGGELLLQNNTNLTMTLNGAGDLSPAITFSNFGDIIRTQGTGSVTLNTIGSTVVNDVFDLNITTDTGDINITLNGGNFDGTTADFISNSGNINITALASDFIAPTRFYTEGQVTVASNSTNLTVNGAGVLSGTNTAPDITVRRDVGSIDMGGVNTTGGALAVRANTVTQTNQLLTNTGNIGFAPATNSVGTGLNPIRIDGAVTGGAVGDMFLESVNSLDLVRLVATNITGTGGSFRISGGDTFVTNATLTSTGDISRSGGGSELRATGTVTLVADTVGVSGDVEFEADTLNVTANDIRMDRRGGVALTNVNITNTGAGDTVIFDSGEGTILSDDKAMGIIRWEPVAENLTYTTVGTKFLDDVFGGSPGTYSLVTTGAITGNIDGADNITLSGTDINVTASGFLGVQGLLNATATAGNVNVVSSGNFGGDDIQVNANATGTVSVRSIGGNVTTGAGNLTGTMVTVQGDNVNVNTVTGNVSATGDSGDVTVNNTGDLAVQAAALMGMMPPSCDVVINSSGNITTTGDIVGNTVTLNSTTGGSISTNVGHTIGGITSTTLTGLAGVNVDTATPNLTVTSAGPVVVRNTAADLAVDVNNAAGTTNITTSGNLNSTGASSIEGTQVTVSGAIVGDSAALEVNTPDVVATSTSGAIDLSLNGPGPVAVSAIANAGASDVTIGSNVAISARDIQGDTVMITGGLAGPTITSISDSIVAATTMTVASQGAIDIDTQAPDIFSTSATSIRIDNTAPTAAIRTSAPAGPVIITNTGDLTSTSLIGNSLNLTAASISATGVTSPTITANATGPGVAGNLSLTGTGSDSNITATATNNVTIRQFPNVTGTLDGLLVDIAGTSVNVGLGTNTAEVVADMTVGGGSLTLNGNSPNLEVTALADFMQPVIVNNTGGNISTNRVQGDTINISASGNITREAGGRGTDVLDAPTSITLSGVNIGTALERMETLTPVLNIAGTGDVFANNVFAIPFPMTANIVTTGNVTFTNSGDVNAAPISGAVVDVNLGSNGALTGTVNATTRAVLAAEGIDLDTVTPEIDAVGVRSFVGQILNLNFRNTLGAPLTLTSVTVPDGNINVTNDGDIRTSNISGGQVTLTATNGGSIQNLGNFLIGDIGGVSLTADGSIDADLFQTSRLIADAMGGSLTVDALQAPFLDVTANAAGNIRVSGTNPGFPLGNIIANGVTATGDVTLNTLGGNVTTAPATTITGNLLTLNGGIVNVDTIATGFNVTSTGNTTIVNTSPSLDPVTINAGGTVVMGTTGDALNVNATGSSVTLNAGGALSGAASAPATAVGLTGASINMNVTTPSVVFNATAGDATVTGTNASLMVNGQATGDLTVRNGGDIALNTQVSGTNVTLDTLGAGNLVPSAIPITGSASVNIAAIDALAFVVNTPTLVTNLTGTSPTVITGSGPAMDVNLTNVGDITFSNPGDIAVSQITSGGNVTLGDPTNSTSLTTNPASTINAANLTATGFSTIDIDTQTPSLQLTTAGTAMVDNVGPTLNLLAAHLNVVGGGVPGAMAVTTTGDMSVRRAVSTDDITLTATGHVEATLSPSDPMTVVDLTNLLGALPAPDATVQTDTTITVQGSSVNLHARAPMQNVTSTNGDVNLTTLDVGAAPNVTATANNGNLSVDATGQSLSGTLAGNRVTVVDANQINVGVTTPEMIVTAPISNSITVTGSNPILEFTGSALGGVSITNGGAIRTNNISGGTAVTLDTLGLGPIERVSGSLSGFLVNLNGTSIGAVTNVLGGSISATGTQAINIANTGDPNLGVGIASTGGPVTFNNTGNVLSSTITGTVVDAQATGTFAGSLGGTTSVNVQGTTVNVTPTTPILTATATGGAVTIDDGANANLQVGGSATSNFTVTNTGNIATTSIDANTLSPGTITLNTLGGGDITRSSGRLTAFRTQLNGVNVDADVVANQIGANASNDLIIDSFLAAPVIPIDLVAGNDITFTSVDDATFTTLTAGNNITLDIGADVTGSLTAPGTLSVTADAISLNVSNTSTVNATARTGDALLNGANPGGITVGGSAVNGIFLLTTDGTITTNAVTADTVRLTSTAGDLLQGSGTLTGTSQVFLGGESVLGGAAVNTVTPRLTVAARSGNANISNTGDLGPAASTITSTGGDVTLMNTGNVAALTATGNNATVTATGSVDASVTANTGTATVSGTSVNGTVTGDTQAITASAGDINVTTAPSSGSTVNLTASATGGVANITGSPATSLTGSSVTGDAVTIDMFDSIFSSVTTPSVTLTNITGTAIINGSNANLAVTANNPGATSIAVANSGNIALNDVAAGDVVIRTLGAGDVTRSSGTVTATNLVNIDANAVGAAGTPILLDTPRMTVLGTGDVFVDNAQALTAGAAQITTPGAVTFNNTGDVIAPGASFSGSVVNVVSTGALNAALAGTTSVAVQGTSVTTTPTTPSLTATATAGSVTINDGANANLAVDGSATGGSFNVNNSGNIATGAINASGNINLDTNGLGDITRTSGRLVTPGNVDLRATNVTAQTEAGSVSGNAANDLFLENFTAVVNPVILTAGNDLTFINSLGGANLSNLNAGNDLTVNLGGAATGSLTGNTVSVTATSVNISAVTNQVNATSTAGGVTVTGTNPSLAAILTATGGPISLTNDGDITVTATADTNQNVTVSTNSMGSIATNQITGAAIDLNAGTGNITRSSGSLNGTSVSLTGAGITSTTVTGDLTATGTGAVTVTNTGDLDPASLSSSGGDVTLSNTGNVANLTASGQNATVNASGTVSGSVAATTGTTGRATVSGQSVSGTVTGDLQTVTSSNGNIDITVASIDGPNVNLTAGATGGGVTVVGPGQSLVGSLAGDSVVIDGLNGATVGVTTPVLALNNIVNGATITGTNANLDLTGSSAGASLDVRNAGNIRTGAVTAQNIIFDTLASGAITRTSGTLTAPGTVSLAGNSIGTSGNNSIVDTPNVVANASGDIFITNLQGTAGTVTSTGGAVGFTSGGGVLGSYSGDTVNLTASGPVAANFSGTTSVNVQGGSLDITASTPDLTANATAGSANIKNAGNPTMAVTGSSTDAFSVTNAGNIAAGPITATNSISLDTTDGVGGPVAGDITQSSGRLIAPNVSLNGINVTSDTQTDILVASATNNLVIENFVTNPTDANLTAGNDLTFTTGGDVNFTNLNSGNNLSLNLGRAITGNLTANVVNVTGTLINLDVTANEVNATATAGDVTLTGTNANVQVSASATGNVNVSNTGNVALNAVQGTDITVNVSGNITDAGSNSFTGDNVSVTSTGGTVTTGNFAVGSATVNGTGDVQVGNVDSTAFDGAGGAVSVTSSGGSVATGAINTNGTGNGATVNLSANTTLASGAIDSSSATGDGGAVTLVGNGGITTGTINTSAPAGSAGTVMATSSGGALSHDDINSTGSTGGDVTLNADTTVTVQDIDTTGGTTNVDITTQGDVEFARIVATNVNITTAGDVTDTSNTIIANNVAITGNNINVNTQANNIDINGSGNVNVTNSGSNVNALNVAAGGGVNFQTDANLTVGGSGISSSGGNVGLTVGGNIGQFSSGSPFVSGGIVTLTAGGTITPNVNNALNVSASSGIVISAQGGGVAGAISGSVAPGAVTIASGSGPIFYNGVFLNAPPVPPVIPVVSPAPAINVLGQEGNQTVDDGSVGTASNDGIVEKSPTEKLVAQLTGGGGDEGAPTEFLVTLGVDELGEVSVSIGPTPSPFDEAIDNSEDMSAEDILDLDSGELTDVKVKVLYDPAEDQLVLAIDLSADDIIDLDMEDYQEVPVDMNYTIVGDPKLMKEKLSADGIIDLEVEDLGLIPIKILLTGDNEDGSEADFLEIGLQELMTIPVYVEGK